MIREAQPTDAAVLARIYVEAWNAGFRGLRPARTHDAVLSERWRADLSAARYRWWVVERDGEIVGFAGIGPSRDPVDPRVGELDTIAVAPSAWRTGVGRTLMAEALLQLESDGYARAILWTLTNYERGHRFYEAMGWTCDGDTRAEGSEVRFSHPLRA